MSATDDEFGPETPEQRPAPEAGELQLRKALSTMNDLEPPRDDLFAQRAIIRGRARTSRRRSTLLGAAAALVVVGAVGGTWLANHGASSSSAGTSAASAPELQRDSSGGAGSDTGSGNGLKATGGPETERPSAVSLPPGVSPVDGGSMWLAGYSTPQARAFTALEATLAGQWSDVFSGAYAADADGSRIAVAVTRHDSALESLVTGAMPSPSDVDFVLAKHSYGEKARVLREIDAARANWRAKGVQIIGLSLDGRSDQVVVLADEGRSAGLVAQQYGDLVRVVPTVAGPPGKLPDGSTLPTLQQ
jgi:hypothetical protein